MSFIVRNKVPLHLESGTPRAEALRTSMGLTESEAASYMGMPLVVDDEVLGVLAILDRENTGRFGESDHRILTSMAAQLGKALQNAGLFKRLQNFADEMNNLVADRTKELQEERSRLDMLYQITAELALTLDIDRVLSRVLQMIARAAKAHDGVIMLTDPMSDKLYNRASLSHPSQAPESDRQTYLAESLASWLIENNHELLVDDLHQESFWDRSVVGAEQWRSAIAVLLETNEDVQGVLVLLNRDAGAFSEPLLNFVTAAANQVASAINNADLYQLIRDQAERLGTLLRAEQEEADRNRAILENISDGVIILNKKGFVAVFNENAESLLEFEAVTARGSSLEVLLEKYGDQVRQWIEPLLDLTGGDMMTEDRHQSEPIQINKCNITFVVSPVYTGPQHLGAVIVLNESD